MNRVVSILDEVVTGIIVASIMYFLGKTTGNLEGRPWQWLTNATGYVILSALVVVFTVVIYVIWQRRSK